MSPPKRPGITTLDPFTVTYNTRVWTGVTDSGIRDTLSTLGPHGVRMDELTVNVNQ